MTRTPRFARTMKSRNALADALASAPSVNSDIMAAQIAGSRAALDFLATDPWDVVDDMPFMGYAFEYADRHAWDDNGPDLAGAWADAWLDTLHDARAERQS